MVIYGGQLMWNWFFRKATKRHCDYGKLVSGATGCSRNTVGPEGPDFQKHGNEIIFEARQLADLQRKARILSQEEAICVIDTGSTVLRANQSKLRKEKSTNDVADSREQDQSAPTAASSLPRERPDVPDDQSQEHLAPEVYWIISQLVTMGVMELADGSGILSAIWNQHGLRTRECFILARKVFSTILLF